MEDDHDQHSPSFKLKLKSSICASSCFAHPSDTASSSSSTFCDDDAAFDAPPPLHSRSSWIKSRAHDLPEEIKGKCATFFSKIGGKANRRSNNNTSEFRYDPMSYALNFDDQAARVNDFPLRNFSARLPPSPPPPKKRFAVAREIAACS